MKPVSVARFKINMLKETSFNNQENLKSKNENWAEAFNSGYDYGEKNEDQDKLRREILEKFEVKIFFDYVRKQQENDAEFREIVANPNFLRGYLFEYLVNQEINMDNEDDFLGEYIIRRLQKPQLLGLGEWAMRNPDHLGVEVDSEKGIAYITGMYEVKMGKRVNPRTLNQIKNFYGNLKAVIEAINENLDILRKHEKNLPPKGITLESFDEIYKFIVAPRPESDYEKNLSEDKKKILNKKGWQVHDSIFSFRAVEKMTRYITDNYSKQYGERYLRDRAEEKRIEFAEKLAREQKETEREKQINEADAKEKKIIAEQIIKDLEQLEKIPNKNKDLRIQ